MRRRKIHSKLEDRGTLNIFNTIRKIFIVTIIFSILLSNFGKTKPSLADANTQVRVQIDYLEELAYITAGNGQSDKFYLSTDEKKTWEMLEITDERSLQGAMWRELDISTFLTAKPITLYFKGNKDGAPVAVPIQGEANGPTVTYKITGGIGRIEFSPVSVVQYRKGTNGSWITVTPATNSISTSKYEVRGATLYFRIAPQTNTRASKIITVKIPKKPSGPSVKLDGGKFAITGLKSGVTQYRKGEDTVWSTFTSTDSKVKTLSLYDLFAGKVVSNNPLPAGVLEFRTVGTDKKLTSSVKVIEIPAQEIINSAYVSLIGTTLKILDPDTKKPYEYTKVEKGAAFVPDKAKWTTINPGKAVIIPRIAVQDTVYVRVKSRTDKATKQVIPASTYSQPYTITSITTGK